LIVCKNITKIIGEENNYSTPYKDDEEKIINAFDAWVEDSV